MMRGFITTETKKQMQGASKKYNFRYILSIPELLETNWEEGIWCETIGEARKESKEWKDNFDEEVLIYDVELDEIVE